MAVPAAARSTQYPVDGRADVGTRDARLLARAHVTQDDLIFESLALADDGHQVGARPISMSKRRLDAAVAHVLFDHHAVQCPQLACDTDGMHMIVEADANHQNAL